MGFFGIVGISILISNAIMTIVMINGGKSFMNTLWALFCTCGSILGVSLFYISFAETPEQALTWWKIAYLWIANLPVLLLHTTLVMLEEKEKKLHQILIITYIITAVFYLLNLYDKLTQNVTFLFDEIYINTPYTLWFIGFFIFFITVAGIVINILIRSYKDPFRSDKDLILYFMMGIGLGIIGYVSLIFPVFQIEIYPYGSILIAIYPLIIGFSILNHRLFNAKYEFIQFLKVIIVGVLSCISIGWVIWVLAYFFWYAYQINILDVIISSSFIGFFLFFYRNTIISRIFLLESMREFRKETKKFLERKSVFSDFSELLVSLKEYFWKGLRIRDVNIIKGDEIGDYPHIMTYFEKNAYPLIRGSISKNPSHMNATERIAIAHEIESLGNIVFRIENVEKTKPIWLVLGPKESEKAFNEEEINAIQHIIPKITLAVQILNFNQSLQNEVAIQTQKLELQNKKIESAYEKLKEIDTNKDNFLAIASHELRTPMTIIKWYADLFLKNNLWPLNEDEKLYMKKIYDNTESLINMVNNILDIAKIEAWRMEVNLTEINIKSTIEKSINDFESMFHEKNIGLSLTDTLSLSTISTDEDKFHVIMNNLLSNACKFTSNGGKVNVELIESDAHLHIRVSDTGMGMSERQIEHIFEKFSESNNNNYTKKSIRGTGLWLNLSKQLIEILWWSISVTSKEWFWSCFEITLPL